MIKYNNILVDINEYSATINGFEVSSEDMENLANIHEMVPIAREFIKEFGLSEEVAWKLSSKTMEKLEEFKEYSWGKAFYETYDEYLEEQKTNDEMER